MAKLTPDEASLAETADSACETDDKKEVFRCEMDEEEEEGGDDNADADCACWLLVVCFG